LQTDAGLGGNHPSERRKCDQARHRVAKSLPEEKLLEPAGKGGVMLVLTRKADQQIQIGPDICVTVVTVKGSGVRLGIEAPADIQILRGELLSRQGVTQPVRPAASDHPIARDS
jgi:carbon storage regulator CsrA